MRFSSFTLLALLGSAVASPTSTHVIHEKRSFMPFGWWRHHKLQGHERIPVRIGLTQSNLDKGDGFLMELSHPESEKYGQHWSAKQVAETFAPSQESVDIVTDWLTSAGISPERLTRSQSLGWINFDASVDEAESLLKTKFHVYMHKTGQPHIGCDGYSVPGHVRPHVDFITPTVHFDQRVDLPRGGKVAEDMKKRQEAETTSTAAVGSPVETKIAEKVGSPISGSLPKPGPNIDIFGFFDSLSTCNTRITPNCLRALYRFPPNFGANPKNSYGIVEYTPQAYLQGDLDLFFANFTPQLVGKSPILNSIDGGVVQTFATGFRYNGESDLDLEYAMSLVYPQEVTLYQVGDLVQGASFNNFLDAIDGSYCTFEGGDDPTQDAIYPSNFTGGFQGPQNCGGFAATNVISTSYGYNEADLTPAYELRQCREYMKLGLQGVTVLYSSGDYGVGGNSGRCIDPVTKLYNNGTSGIFNPSFPGGCPYVTSVGATQIQPGASVTAPEKACETVIYSGGGFSNVFPLPDYQADAVQTWFRDHPPPYGADRFNNSQRTRGIPDVSANGANYVVAVDGKFSLIYGTSASAPTFGAIITIINEVRLSFGKGPVGFVNPALYHRPDVLNDITLGGNQGCGTPGFQAATGWDPVTGLGTPNFPRMVDLFLGLP